VTSRRAAAALSLAVFLVVIVPWQGALDRLGDAAAIPTPSGAPDYNAAVVALLGRGLVWRVEPDFSYYLVFHEGFARHGAWPLLTTMGPWGFLYAGYEPATFLPLLTAWIVLAAVFWFSAWRQARGALVPLLALAFVVSAVPRPALLLLLPALLVLRVFDGASRNEKLLLGTALALAMQVKSTTLVLGVAALVVIAVPRAWSAIAAAGVAFLGFWLAAGQSLAWLPPFLTGTLRIVGGYGEAVALGGDGGWSAMAFALAVVALLIMEVSSGKTGVMTAWLMMMAWSLAKAGFIRNDPTHRDLALAAIVAMVVLHLPATLKPGWRMAILAACVAVIAPLAMSPREVLRQATALINPVAARRASDALFAADMAAIRARNPLPPLHGTVDFIAQRQSIVIAHGLDYLPRPLFQSYLASDGTLAMRNAAGLRADNVLVEITPFDGRFPTLDDAAVWPALLVRYDLAAVSQRMLVFRKSAHPRPWLLGSPRWIEASLGQAIGLRDTPAWATIAVRPTAAGRLVSFFYKLPELRLSVTTADGHTRDYRLVRRVAADGFLLSPLLNEPLDLAALAAGRHGDEVVSITVTAPGDRFHLYDPHIIVTFRKAA
jgi:hypothetical protein